MSLAKDNGDKDAQAIYPVARAIRRWKVNEMGDHSKKRSGSLGEGSTSRGEQFLRYGALLYAAGLALHLADHLRRGTDVLTPQVQAAGYLSTAVGLVVIALVLSRHRLAPLMAAVTGISIAFGVAAVHLLPHWSAFSDAFPGARNTGVTALSWTVVLVEIAGALALGLAGVFELRRRGHMGRTRAA